MKGPCPDCQTESLRVIYMGFPMWLCPSCAMIWGVFSFIPAVYFNGFLIHYSEEYSYWQALWHWLKGDFSQ